MNKKQQLDKLLNRPIPVIDEPNNSMTDNQNQTQDTFWYEQSTMNFAFKDIQDLMDTFDGNNVDIIDIHNQIRKRNRKK